MPSVYIQTFPSAQRAQRVNAHVCAVSHFISRLPGAAMAVQKAARLPLLPVAALTLLAVISAQRE